MSLVIDVQALTNASKAQFIAIRMREAEVWRNATDDEFDNALEAMEKLVMNRLYELFVYTKSVYASKLELI